MELERIPRIVQEIVPGKQITLAHVIANPDAILYQKLGLDPAVDYSKAAIGIVTMSPSETAIIAGDIAIKASGVSCVIAETFARIFYRNAINIGLPIIECPEAAKAIEAGDEVEVDFDSGIITDKTKNTSYQGQAFPPFMQKIIDCEGLVNYINQK